MIKDVHGLQQQLGWGFKTDQAQTVILETRSTMWLSLIFWFNMPFAFASTRTFFNELDTGPSKASPHKTWPSSYPPPLPLWAIGPQSPFKPRRKFVPYFGLSWLSTTTTTTTTTTERPYVPFSSCSHLPPICSSYFASSPAKPLPTQVGKSTF